MYEIKYTYNFYIFINVCSRNQQNLSVVNPPVKNYPLINLVGPMQHKNLTFYSLCVIGIVYTQLLLD